MKTKLFGIPPLVLCFPSLMALTPEEAKSFNEYGDFAAISYVMNCEPIGITAFKWSLLILTCLAAISIIFAIVLCVFKRYDKLSFKE